MELPHILPQSSLARPSTSHRNLISILLSCLVISAVLLFSVNTIALWQSITLSQPFVSSAKLGAFLKEDVEQFVMSTMEESNAYQDNVNNELETETETDPVKLLYGSRRYSLGFDDDTCKRFLAHVPDPQNRLIGVAGLFNTGTNLLGNVMNKHCQIPERNGGGMRSQVPWGKHNPSFWRTLHSAKSSLDVNQTNVLPVVIIKDPLFWMSSMCRHSYAANWNRRAGHCPNLVHNDELLNPMDATSSLKRGDLNDFVDLKTYHVDVNYQNDKTHEPPGKVNYNSLVDLWNQWYENYVDLPTPRLMVRFEDWLFSQEEVARDICECVDGEWKRDNFEIVENSAKGDKGAHENANGREEAIARYGNIELREEGFNDVDLAFARQMTSTRLKKLFNYK